MEKIKELGFTFQKIYTQKTGNSHKYFFSAPSTWTEKKLKETLSKLEKELKSKPDKCNTGYSITVTFKK